MASRKRNHARCHDCGKQANEGQLRKMVRWVRKPAMMVGDITDPMGWEGPIEIVVCYDGCHKRVVRGDRS